VVNLAIKFGANLALGALGSERAGVAGNSLLVTLGLGLFAEGLVVLYRALRSDHRVMWTQGRDGAPHQMSPFLDDLQRSLTSRGANNRDDDPASGWNTRLDRDHHR
jgi:hypothetical protein